MDKGGVGVCMASLGSVDMDGGVVVADMGMDDTDMGVGELGEDDVYRAL